MTTYQVVSKKNASKQLTSSLPAIVHVDISALNQKMKIVDLDDLEVQIRNVLRNNSRINAVVITDTYVTGPDGNAVIKNGIWVICNLVARHKLSESFSIPNEINPSKESLIADNYWVIH